MTGCTRASDYTKMWTFSCHKANPLLTAILQRDSLPVPTCTQPWATLVAVGTKQIETRSWETSYRGPLAIHAARCMPAYAVAACSDNLFRQVLQAHGYTYRSDTQANVWGPPLGHILAVVWVEEVWRTPLPPQMQVTAQERAFGKLCARSLRLDLLAGLSPPHPDPGAWHARRVGTAATSSILASDSGSACQGGCPLPTFRRGQNGAAWRWSYSFSGSHGAPQYYPGISAR